MTDEQIERIITSRLESTSRVLADEIKTYLAHRQAPPPQIKPVAAEQMKWVKVNKYCDLSGDTAEAVRARRRSRKWTEGLQWVKREGSIWINPEEVEKWVQG